MTSNNLIKNDISKESQSVQTKRLGLVLLKAGSLMQSNGASTARSRMTVERIAHTFNHSVDLFITHRAINLTVSDRGNRHTFTGIRRGAPPTVNFMIISGISKLSWRAADENLTIDEIGSELARIEALPKYRKILTLFVVGVAGASFCGLAGGGPLAMLIAMIASFSGLFIRQEAHRLRLNSYLCVFLASFGATLIAGASQLLLPFYELESAFATSILFLIPGVPLINSFTDLIDGNILNGMLRAANGLMISFMIALGMICSLIIFGQ